MRIVKIGALNLVGLFVVLGIGYLNVNAERIHAATNAQLDPPTLSVTGSTQTSITIQVCAGASGAPGGFSLHWKTANDYALYGWSSDSGDSYQAASFTAFVAGSRYGLDPGECVDVVPGAFSQDAGFSVTDGGLAPLECGTEYAFRAFAHADGVSTRSTFTPTLVASAAACVHVEVEIDIKPGAFPNTIQLGSNGTVAVGILSSPGFDATTVDPLTVSLAGAHVRLRGQGKPMSSAVDLNNDGLLDLVVHVSTEALQLTDGDTEAILDGLTSSGTPIRGTDSVRIVG